MTEKYIWRAVLWTLLATAVIGLIAGFDPGFIVYYPIEGIIPVSTGQRVEIPVVRTSALTRDLQTDLYFFETDGSFRKVTTFPDALACVTGYQGQLFICFRAARDEQGGGPSAIYKDGQWVRGVSAPADMRIADVAPFEGTVYAVAVTGDGKEFRILALGQNGWEQRGDPFDAGPELGMRGLQSLGKSLEVVYSEGAGSLSDVTDLAKVEWFHVSFDGAKWGKPERIDVPPGYLPVVDAYNGALALGLVPLGTGIPVRIATVQSGKLETLVEIPTRPKQRVTRASLADLGGQHHVFLAGPGHLWDVPLVNGVPGSARELLSIEEGSRVRSNLYVALWLLCSVLMVALGITWLVMRLKNFGRGRKN